MYVLSIMMLTCPVIFCMSVQVFDAVANSDQIAHSLCPNSFAFLLYVDCFYTFITVGFAIQIYCSCVGIVCHHHHLCLNLCAMGVCSTSCIRCRYNYNVDYYSFNKMLTMYIGHRTSTDVGAEGVYPDWMSQRTGVFTQGNSSHSPGY